MFTPILCSLKRKLVYAGVDDEKKVWLIIMYMKGSVFDSTSFPLMQMQ